MPSNTIVSPPSKTIKKFKASLQIIKNQFCKLQQDLALKEDYIKYLEKEILIQDKDLDLLKSSSRLQTQLADLQTQLTDLQTQLAMLQNDYGLLHQAYEAYRTQHNIFKSRELDGQITICMQKRQISKLLAEKFTLHLLNRQTQKQLQNCEADRATTIHLLNLTRNRYIKWKNKCKTQENNLLLANVQLNNKWVAGDLTSIALLIAKIPNYSGQIPPDEWYQRINQILTLLSIMSAAFDNPLRADILKIATQRLAQEKFLLFDNSESYEARIHPLLLEVADNDANILGLLKSHLSGELYTWMKIANPASINAFFTELKNMWLEHSPNLYKGSIPVQISQTSAQKQPDFSNYLRVSDKYMPERPPDGYSINSEKFIHCDLINPTPSASQIIESLVNDLYKKVSDMFLAKPVQSKKNIEVNSDKELADHIELDTILISVLERNLKIPRDLAIIKKIDKEPKFHKRGGSKQTVLEQTIRKIIQSELKDILSLLLQKLNFNNEKLYYIQNNNYQEPAPETLDEPMEIDFVFQKKPNTGIATIPCKIKCLKIPAMILDSRAETEIITEDIVKCINGKFDRSVKYNLSDIATIPIESIDGLHNKDTITSKPLVSDQISQEVDSDKNDSIPLEEWHAPQVQDANMLANIHTLQNIKGHQLGSIREEELEKKIHDAIKFKAEINKLSEKLQDKYKKQMKAFDRERKG
ncbi:24349_t:CDS:2 [Cetraspora pellucida]|uniref:24349_t:CDS:1 n=1 Tax=Cetraspora pellucida TaxID=1433469 RepID=A0A9N8W6R0_9GLOM|nr:24349_t:CDS:2 [Cetraspora pellucida]